MKPTQLIQGDRVLIKCDSGDVEAWFVQRSSMFKFAPRMWLNKFKTIEHQHIITLSNAEVIHRVKRK